MEKIIPIFLLSLMLVGCGTTPRKPETEIVEVSRPVLYCPAPNWEELKRPDPLAIDSIVKQTPDGEVAQRYKVTIIQLRDYASRLEKSLQQYDSTNKAYDDLKKQFMEDKAKDGFIEK